MNLTKIDLNATLVDCFDDEDGEQGNPHLPISVVNLVPDLNMSSNFEEFEFDLNNESFEQDEISKATTYRLLKSGVIRRHSNAIKPLLKEGNMKSQIEFCLSMLEPCGIPRDPIFIGMYNIIHIDEKWFYMTKRSRNYYMLVDEEDPIRSCKSINFIDKVMFLVALARPRFDAQGRELFSGKIGIFPLVTYEPAKRTSVSRIAGTLETKPIASVNKEVIRSFLIQKVLPAIKEKWPREDTGCPIIIQQDNARTHIDLDDAEFCRVASEDGFDIRLMCQPPNSPDMNVLDLGFFSALQSLQYKKSPKTIDELIGVVVKAFEDYPTIKFNRIFLTLQLCMIEVMKAKDSTSNSIASSTTSLSSESSTIFISSESSTINLSSESSTIDLSFESSIIAFSIDLSSGYLTRAFTVLCIFKK
ncbi:mariner transposase [Senna tora]|uniref:Mariner transposase n=1 Tax=Senna tora TaxID=362788 RepID=A0A834T226_9FABA|nr:mariner transposase [Senna tora]